MEKTIPFMKKLLFIILLALSFLIAPLSAQAITTYNGNGLTGGTQRDVDYLSVADLNNGDRFIVMTGTIFYFFKYSSTATDAENTTTHPFKVRPDDYASAGVWIEQELATGAVDAAIIATDAVGADEILADAVRESEIQADAVGSSEIIANAISTSELSDALEIKAWLQFSGENPATTYNYNISSIVDNGVGDYSIIWDTNFAGPGYACVTGVGKIYQENDVIASTNVYSADSLNLYIFKRSDGSGVDVEYISLIAIGTQ